MTQTPWILVNLTHKDLDTKKLVFMDSDGNTTTDPLAAKTFLSEKEAKKVADDKPDEWVPKPVGDYLLPKVSDEADVDKALIDAELRARRQRIDELERKGAVYDSGSRTYSLEGRSYDEDGNLL